jgi:hypothetical protein
MSRRIHAIFVLLALIASGCASGATGSFGSWTPPIEATEEIAAMERQMADLVNRDRSGKGLPPLKFDPALADIARGHSLDMRDHGFFAHESPTTGRLEDRMMVAGYLALEMRENLAQAPDVRRAEENLMESPGHHANIMATSVSHIGVGIVRGAEGDPRVLTITQVFARPTELDTPEQVRTKVERALGEARSSRGMRRLEPHPMLQELAEANISGLPDDVPESAVRDVGNSVSSELNERQGHGLMAIRIVAQAFFNGDEFTVSDAALDGRTTAYGLATEKAVDAVGRPRVKVLLLLGQSKR